MCIRDRSSTVIAGGGLGDRCVQNNLHAVRLAPRSHERLDPVGLQDLTARISTTAITGGGLGDRGKEAGMSRTKKPVCR